jgi:hypothetical protein
LLRVCGKPKSLWFGVRLLCGANQGGPLHIRVGASCYLNRWAVAVAQALAKKFPEGS